MAVAILALVISAIVGSGRSYGQCNYDVTVIQPPPCPPPVDVPPTDGLGLNELGHVVGAHTDCAIVNDHAFVWTPGPGLVALDMPTGTLTSTAYDISDGGLIVGEFDITGDGLGFLGFLCDGETVVNLGTMPNGGQSVAEAVNNAGVVVGYWANPVFGLEHGFRWEGGVMSDLGPILGTPKGGATDINELGHVTGWMGSSFGLDNRAFILQGESLIALPPVPGGYTSVAQALNNRGDAGGRGIYTDPDTGNTFSRAFAWVDGVMNRIDPLPGLSRSSARGINDAQQVVGYAWESSTLRGFIWQDGVLTDLNDLVPPEFYIRIANGINNAGQIVASGSYDDESAALLLTPANQPPGDIDHDCIVGIHDFLMLLAAWGPCPPDGGCPGDFNGDGAVDIVDFLKLLAHWG
jgi:probable HAF family extracellular repeat protein